MQCLQTFRRALLFIAPAAIMTSLGAKADPPPQPSPPAVPACAPEGKPNGTLFSVAADGTVFIAPHEGKTVYRFAPGAKGDAVPESALCGSDTMLRDIRAITVSRGTLYVVEGGQIATFPDRAAGDAAPATYLGDPSNDDDGLGINNSVGGPMEIRVGADGTIYVLSDKATHEGQDGGCGFMTYVFPPSVRSVPSAIATYYPTDPAAPKDAACPFVTDFVLDTKARSYFTDTASDVLVSRPKLGEPNTLIAHLARPYGIALDGTGKLYVGNGASIDVITGPASDRPSIAHLQGPLTKLTQVTAIETDDAGKIYVQNCAPDRASILVFAAGAIGNVAPLYILGGPHTHQACAVRQ